MSISDPIQAGAMECANKILTDIYSGSFGDSVKSTVEKAMRELVARERIKDAHAFAALREERDDYKQGAEIEAKLADEARAERDALSAQLEDVTDRYMAVAQEFEGLRAHADALAAELGKCRNNLFAHCDKRSDCEKSANSALDAYRASQQAKP
jgi:chromosome segregation ATPase